MTFDSQSIKEFSSLSQSNSNPKEVFYGVLPNSGSIDIIDRDGELKDYAVEGYLNKQTFTIVISINDQEVQHHITIESPYYNNQRFLELNLTNSLSQWNNINFLGFSYEFTETLYEVLTSIFSISLDMESEDVDDMLDTVINIGSEDITVKQYLNRIIIEDIDLEQSSLREAVDKVCNVALLQVIENDEGEIKFISARPLATQDEKDNAKVIPLKMQKKEFEYEILLSNKYEDVDFM